MFSGIKDFFPDLRNFGGNKLRFIFSPELRIFFRDLWNFGCIIGCTWGILAALEQFLLSIN